MNLKSLKIGQTVIAEGLNPDHWIKRIEEIKNHALKEKDERRIRDFCQRLDGIVASILIGPHKNDPDVKKISEAKIKAIEEIKQKTGVKW